MIIVRRTYIPKPGSGGELLKLVRQAADAMEQAGFGAPAVYRTYSGLHGAIVTDQPWPGIQDYQDSREAVRKTEAITSVFGRIYPLLASTHHTEILEQVA